MDVQLAELAALCIYGTVAIIRDVVAGARRLSGRPPPPATAMAMPDPSGDLTPHALLRRMAELSIAEQNARAPPPLDPALTRSIAQQSASLKPPPLLAATNSVRFDLEQTPTHHRRRKKWQP